MSANPDLRRFRFGFRFRFGPDLARSGRSAPDPERFILEDKGYRADL